MSTDRGVTESSLLRAAQHGDAIAERELVARHLDLVRSAAAPFAGVGLQLDDLVQEGCVGLLDAIARWNRSRRLPFETFARLRVLRRLESTVHEELTATPLEAVEEDADLEEQVIAHEETRLVDEAVERLPERQRLVIEHHFGLDGPEESIGEIAEELHLSRRRTLSIERQALATLRRSLDGLRAP